jgi:hypothetical protein
LHLRGKTIEYERVEAENAINEKIQVKKSEDDNTASAGEG